MIVRMPQQIAIQPPVPGQPVQVIVQPVQAPQSPVEYRALMDRRDELTSQLNQAQGQRTQALVEIQTGPSQNVTALRGRVHSLEARIERLQTEVDRTNDLIINTSP